MNSVADINLRVLALDPFSRGFGFAVLEGSTLLVDYGIAVTCRNEKARGIQRVVDLIERLQPAVLVFEGAVFGRPERTPRIRLFLEQVRMLARNKRIRIRELPRSQVQRVFLRCRARTKREIAVVLSRLFPELESRLPPVRKPWMSEDSRIHMFTAVALAVVFLSPQDQ